ncbi:MAG: DUF3365 domain-containing protein [Planctomycetes bacterium]|nr:DUF3365 domain-containing protein [Planctomycetota bacterium]MCH9778731.1 DUF3365 domain-containing protein [Planctomycetota bacterium]MCH9790015.1 DUF3365 domain-containing protein [Planctomycetota bacterium]MDF1743470.1 DUF3365 domain-containing protein [Gimesia sp.]
MHSTKTTISCLLIVSASVFYIAAKSFAEPPTADKGKAVQDEKSVAAKTTTKKKSTEKRLVTVEVARERAKLTHNLYASTLEAMHHYYFFNDRSSVPARVMEDMFKDIDRQENIKAKWIAVNAKVMSIDHKPEGDFEKQAAKEIAAGKHEYERVEKGVYRRAVAISLNNNGCLGCHLGFGANKNKKERFAGLVLTIPVKQD